MTIEKQIEAAAMCDGYVVFCNDADHFLYGKTVDSDEHQWEEIDDYLNDYNAMHGLVRRMDNGQAERFWEILRRMTHDGGMGTHYYQNADAVQATCAQMLEAYLKAKGVWK